MSAPSASFLTKHNINILTPDNPKALALEKKQYSPVIHGDKVWSSTYVLMDYLLDNPPPQNSRFMDVGCGWGLLSAFAAKELNLEVLAVDADPNVLPYALLHAEINNTHIQPLELEFDDVEAHHLAGVHTLVGVDICFWDKLQPSLYNLVQRALEAGVEQIIVADPGRGPFHDLSDRCETHLNGRVEIHHCTTPVEDSAELLIIEKDLLPY